MILLLVGILLWSLSHGFKRIAPAQRKALGNRGKILTTAGILLGLILMIIGYQQADLILIWSPPTIFKTFEQLSYAFIRCQFRCCAQQRQNTRVATSSYAYLS